MWKWDRVRERKKDRAPNRCVKIKCTREQNSHNRNSPFIPNTFDHDRHGNICNAFEKCELLIVQSKREGWENSQRNTYKMKTIDVYICERRKKSTGRKIKWLKRRKKNMQRNASSCTPHRNDPTKVSKVSGVSRKNEKHQPIGSEENEGKINEMSAV